MPNSFGPFKGKVVKRMIKSTISKCKVVMSRESISQQVLLNECGVESILSDDLAFYLKKPVNEVGSLAIVMEMKGIVFSAMGKVFIAKA